MNSKSPFVLDDWTVEPEFNQLSKGNTSHRIEPKVMSVLLELADQAPRVVSKEEILSAVWPDTFVGEDALTRCISVLRHILEDDPHNPRYIKTVSKVGYCLLVVGHPPEPLPEDIPRRDALEMQEGKERPAPQELRQGAMPTVPPSEQVADKRWAGIRIGAVVLCLALAGGLVFWAIHATFPKPVPAPIRTFQLTTNAGEQSRPALSPDGKKLAFVWAKEDGGRQHIYIKELGNESLLRLTDLSDDEYSPTWSPDGKQIAFLSSSEAGLGLYIASLAAPHSVRKVYIPEETTRWDQGALSWSPDGKSFVLVDHMGAQPSSSIYLIDVESMRAHTLTSSPPGWEGDLNPVYSPDGKKIAFLRASESWVVDLYWIPTSGGEPRQITRDDKTINGITWSSDSRSIVFSSNRAGQFALWKVALDGGTPQRMPVGTEGATQPAISLNGSNLAFVEGSAIFGIMRVSASKDESHETREPLIVSSTAQDSAPSISPDGAQFAFQSWRSGSQQIWVSSIDGQSLRQLTPLDDRLSVTGSPSWSPEGDLILFDSRIDGHSHIFAIAATGGKPQQITFGEVNDIVPRWSADGHSIYFRSNRGGRWQLWKKPAAGGTPQPVTTDDGIVGQESSDGKWLYFARGGEDGIWRMPASGGHAVRILDEPAAGYWAYWAVTHSGIYFLSSKQQTPSIKVFNPVTQKITVFSKLNRLPPLYSGLSLLQDGREVLISDKHDAGSHISIAQSVF
ncbi:MAG: DPP IV N-terminal domain-containing protein [Terracidiphilus sp.]|jgi:Tol biopolymer transport system component/DNA-binding winged helix-turn-helix (wHTH) protein